MSGFPSMPLRTFCAESMAMSSLVLWVADPKCGIRTKTAHAIMLKTNQNVWQRKQKQNKKKSNKMIDSPQFGSFVRISSAGSGSGDITSRPAEKMVPFFKASTKASWTTTPMQNMIYWNNKSVFDMNIVFCDERFLEKKEELQTNLLVPHSQRQHFVSFCQTHFGWISFWFHC